MPVFWDISLLRIANGMPMSAALKPSIVEVAVASFIFTSTDNPLVRSINVPTHGALALPLIRSPYTPA
jgi:hypothetical protein